MLIDTLAVQAWNSLNADGEGIGLRAAALNQASVSSKYTMLLSKLNQGWVL
jgi:hypothetical protein